MTLNVGKQEISFTLSDFIKISFISKNLFLLFSIQTLSQRIFYEWIPGLDVSGE